MRARCPPNWVFPESRKLRKKSWWPGIFALAELTGARLHLPHVSTLGSVRMVREAKGRGIPVTAEACPHHFALTDEAVRSYDSNAKMNPPLRTDEDVQAVKEGLRDNTIDIVATDHAPHAVQEKQLEFDAAPFGIIGLETALPLTLNLVEEGVLSLEQAITKLTREPARVFGLPHGALVPGGEADVTLVDPGCHVGCGYCAAAFPQPQYAVCRLDHEREGREDIGQRERGV